MLYILFFSVSFDIILCLFCAFIFNLHTLFSSLYSNVPSLPHSSHPPAHPHPPTHTCTPTHLPHLAFAITCCLVISLLFIPTVLFRANWSVLCPHSLVLPYPHHYLFSNFINLAELALAQVTNDLIAKFSGIVLMLTLFRCSLSVEVPSLISLSPFWVFFPCIPPFLYIPPAPHSFSSTHFLRLVYSTFIFDSFLSLQSP